MTDVIRKLISEPVVTRFRGLNRFVNIAEIPPDSATDLINVMCSLSGGLAPLRQPQPMTGVATDQRVSYTKTVGFTDAPWDANLAGNSTYVFGDSGHRGNADIYIPCQAGDHLTLSAFGQIVAEVDQVIPSGSFTDYNISHTDTGIYGLILVPGNYIQVTNQAAHDTLQVSWSDGSVNLILGPGQTTTLLVPNTGVDLHTHFTANTEYHQEHIVWGAGWGPVGRTYLGLTAYPSDYPVQYVAGANGSGPVTYGGLMGAFVDSSGNVIQPIAIGTGGTVTAPVGTAKLYIGLNVNNYDSGGPTTNGVFGTFTVDIDVVTPGAGSTTTVFTGTCYGFSEFQQANGTRQIISVWGTKIYVMTAVGAQWQVPVQVDDNVDNANYWNMTPSSNILYMANGVRMLKWVGDRLQKWGIKKPSNKPTNPVVTNGAGGVNLTTGRQYRAALKSSLTWALSTASDPSVTSGPATNATIATSIDATADAAADSQIDTIVWYATLDAGTTYYYHSEVPINKTGPTTLTDNAVDPSVVQPTTIANSNTLADNTKQTPLSGNNWEYIVYGVPQWRRVNGPAVGAPLPTMRATKFGLNVPTNATIVGVKVEIAVNAQSSTTSYVSKMNLTKGGVIIGTQKVFGTTDYVIPSVPGSSTNLDFGGSFDMWGATLTPADVNDPTFGFDTIIQYMKDVRVFLFNFNIRVYYTLPISGTTQVNSQVVAQLINEPPPVGKYLKSWGGRILIGGLINNPTDVAYSGYEQILDGRPEEAFPPNNLLQLNSGADWIRGIGEVQAGILIGTRSNEMFMLRGDLEDVVEGVPLNYTEQLETLPFNSGFGSHYAIIKFAHGALYFSAQRSIDQYAGVQQPDTWSLPIATMLRDIPAGLDEKCIGVMYNYLDKDWYVLGIPYGAAATKPNRIVVMDLDMNQENNTGIFLFDVGEFDTLAIVEDPGSGRPMIIMAQAGVLKEINVIVKGDNMLQPTDTTDSSPVAQPFWQSGWWGVDSPQLTKMFRHSYLISNGGTFMLEGHLVNHTTNKWSNPLVIAMNTLRDGIKGTLGKKSRLCRIKIKFPQGIAATVQQLWTSFIPTGER